MTDSCVLGFTKSNEKMASELQVSAPCHTLGAFDSQEVMWTRRR